MVPHIYILSITHFIYLNQAKIAYESIRPGYILLGDVFG